MTCGVTRFQVIRYKAIKLAKRTLIVGSILSAMGWSAYTAASYFPQTVYADHDVIVNVQPFPAMLTRICKAESGLRQFNAKGDVLRGKVEPSDIGYCQINETIWNDKARKMGIDIYTEQGNKDMALYIFNNYGTDPWNSSKQSWK